MVGVELAISRIEANFKSSQNRSQVDIDGVICGLLEVGRSQLAGAMRTATSRLKWTPFAERSPVARGAHGSVYVGCSRADGPDRLRIEG